MGSTITSLYYLQLRQQAMRACHDDIGHLGLDRSLELLRDRFYWPGMNEEMENHI